MTEQRCNEKGCPWRGDPTRCPWHNDRAERDDDHAWSARGGAPIYSRPKMFKKEPR